MSSVPVRRHALGLPAGSIRATHVLMIVGLVCAMILVPTERIRPIPPYLIYLLFMILGHFFAAHGATIAAAGTHGPSPLYLPAGLVRLIVVLALAGAIGWQLYQNEARLHEQFNLSVEELKTQPFLPLILLGAFFLGILVRAVVGRFPPVALQDLEAWLSLLALVGLGIAGIIHLVIQTAVVESIPMPIWEGSLAAVIAFYFGERS
jgi:hypothetical protein